MSGTSAFGTAAWGTAGGGSAPSVTVTAPTGTVTSGGPNLTVSWSYTHPESIAQAQYRVLITNDAGTTTYYDSGWLTGTDTSKVVDLVAAGVPTESTDVSVRVQVLDAESEYAESALQAFAVQWGIPNATITSPANGGVVASSTITTTWTYSDFRSLAQSQYRVKLLFSGVAVHDSGWLAGAGTSYAVPVTLSDSGVYTLTVEVKNTQGVPDPSAAESVFSTDLSSPGSITPEPGVGTVYEIGINGQGYMLYDNRDGEEYRYERVTVPLDPQRFATSETPFSEAVERYTFAGFAEFHQGAGQRFRDRDGALPAAFLDSDGVDPFSEHGRVSLLRTTARELSIAYAGIDAVVVGSAIYMQTNTNQLTHRPSPGGASTAFTVAAAGTIVDLTTDGQYWYACDGASIFRNTSAADPGAAWSTIDAKKIGWAGGRLCAAYATAPSTTPNTFTTLNGSGAEEVASGRLILPTGWSINDFTGGSGKVWFSAYAGDVGAVYVWDLTNAAPFIAWELPKGQIPTAIFWYQGNLMVRTRHIEGTSSAGRATIWRCVVADDGTLVPSLVTTIGTVGDGVDHGVGDFAARGTQVYFSWAKINGTKAGVGILDLATGGYCKGIKESGLINGTVPRLGVWHGRLIFVVNGDAVWIESATTYETTGRIDFSVVDGNSALDKVFDSASVRVRPLAASESVAVNYTTDEGFAYVSAFTLSTLTGQSKTGALDIKARSLGLRITLNGPGNTTPTLVQAQLRFHMTGLADTLVVLPIDCGDNVALLNGTPHPGNGPGKGVLRARLLENLAKTRVSFQDVDWHITDDTEVYEVEQVQVRKTSAYNPNQGNNGVRCVAVVTMRKMLR